MRQRCVLLTTALLQMVVNSEAHNHRRPVIPKRFPRYRPRHYADTPIRQGNFGNRLSDERSALYSDYYDDNHSHGSTNEEIIQVLKHPFNNRELQEELNSNTINTRQSSLGLYPDYEIFNEIPPLDEHSVNHPHPHLETHEQVPPNEVSEIWPPSSGGDSEASLFIEPPPITIKLAIPSPADLINRIEPPPTAIQLASPPPPIELISRPKSDRKAELGRLRRRLVEVLRERQERLRNTTPQATLARHQLRLLWRQSRTTTATPTFAQSQPVISRWKLKRLWFLQNGQATTASPSKAAAPRLTKKEDKTIYKPKTDNSEHLRNIARPRHPQWTPRVSKNEANKRFQSCCQTKNLTPGCRRLCDYDKVDQKQLQLAVLAGKCHMIYMADILTCASGYRDATACCAANGVFDNGRHLCRAYCNPAGGLPSSNTGRQYTDCMTQLPTMSYCFWANLRP